MSRPWFPEVHTENDADATFVFCMCQRSMFYILLCSRSARKKQNVLIKRSHDFVKQVSKKITAADINGFTLVIYAIRQPSHARLYITIQSKCYYKRSFNYK